MQEVNVNKYQQWITEGRSFSDIRNDLLIRGFSDEQTSSIISILNNWWLQEKIITEQKRASWQLKIAGIALFGISIFITIYSLWRSAFTIVVIAAGGITGGLP